MPRTLVSSMVLCSAAVLLLDGCASFRRSTAAPLQVISIPCRVPAPTYETRTREALVKAGFTLVPEPEHADEIEASRPAVYTSTGEGLQMNGPYRWDSRYAAGAISITVQTVHVNPDGTVYPSASHDERSAPSDRRHFMPVIEALRQMCQVGER